MVKNTTHNLKTASTNPDTGNEREEMAKKFLNTWLCQGSTVVKNTTYKLKMADLNPGANVIKQYSGKLPW